MFIKETIGYIDSVLKSRLTDVQLQRAKYFGLCRYANTKDESGEKLITTTITDDGNGEQVTIDDSENLTIWHTTSAITQGQPWIQNGGGFGDETASKNPTLVVRCRMIISGRTESIKISSERLGSIVLMKLPESVPRSNYGIVEGINGINIQFIDIITDQAQCAMIAGHECTPGITTSIINYIITEKLSSNCIATCEQYSFTGC